MTQADCNISAHPPKTHRAVAAPPAADAVACPSNIAADPIGAVLILSGPPGESGTAPAILLRADGSATALHAIPGADGVWSLSEPVEQLTPQKVRDCFLGMKAIRKEAAHEIERLIALLDRLDPDPDLEPSLGFVPAGYAVDAEAEADDEPSLGSTDKAANQEKWAEPGDYTEHKLDLEAEHDGREPDVDDEDGGDDEPSLGWTTTGGGLYSDDDREEEHDGSEPDDTGIGDAGGLAEQTGGAL